MVVDQEAADAADGPPWSKAVDQRIGDAPKGERIALERVRVMRSESERPATPQRAVIMEITASRKAPQAQSAKIIHDEKGKAISQKVPANGTPAKAVSKEKSREKPKDKPAKN